VVHSVGPDGRPGFAPPERIEVGDWADWPWTLLPLIPAAARAAWDKPSTVIWHFQLVADPTDR
jgi:hypothetical protein